MSDLIPIHSVLQRNRERREKDWKAIDGWPTTKYNTNDRDANIGRIMSWIDKYTKGRFYLDLYMVAFEDEEDFVIFKLWYKDE